MNYSRIVIKSNYEKRGDLVLRSYIRAVKKLKLNALLCNDLLSHNEKAYIYGEIKEDNKFHEFITDKVIDFDNYELISDEEIEVIRQLPLSKLVQARTVFEHVLFNKPYDGKLEISTMEDLANDRSVEFDGYDKFCSSINPYRRLSSNEDPILYNAYNNFLFKIKMLNRMKKIDTEPIEYDQYEVSSSLIIEPRDEEELVSGDKTYVKTRK